MGRVLLKQASTLLEGEPYFTHEEDHDTVLGILTFDSWVEVTSEKGVRRYDGEQWLFSGRRVDLRPEIYHLLMAYRDSEDVSVEKALLIRSFATVDKG